MQKGTIKDFKESENFGFITPESGKDVHFNRRAVQPGPHRPEIGAPVEFETGQGRKPGEFTATKVIITGPAPRASNSGPRSSGGVRPGGGYADSARLPKETIFADTFYGDDGQLRQELFFAAPEALADCFRRAELKSTQFRQMYQAFLGFAGPLRDRRLSFSAARERFGVFYVERIVRQVERGVLPSVVKEFLDAHRESALRNEKEMLGLFRYCTNVLCYFGDKEKEPSRR